MSQESTNDNIGGLSGILPVGARLGKYEIVERLGSGGQSIVYKGYDSLLDRYVAIKQVVPHLAAEEKFTQRFRQVAQQLASLGCEQVVTLYELMEEDGGLFVVMEFVEGHTIETTLADHPEPIDPKAALQIIWRIAAGLTAIHKAGIIHRDIKPGNIIVGEGLKVKITDFGVAAKAGAAVSMKLGTTKYMAPELFSGDKTDGRADIYSLGMIAYEMLAGREKFNEVFHDVVRDKHSEALRWMKWHSSSEQVAPPLSEINPDVPSSLSTTVARMLAKEPDQRFANIEELGREIRANFSPRAQRPRKRRGKKRVLAAATGPEDKASAGDGQPPPTREGESSGPITTEIPKVPTSLRRKLAIIGTIVGVVIVSLLVYVVIDRTQQGEIRKQAQTDYRRAETLYKEASIAKDLDTKKVKYAAAMENFRIIASNKQYARQVVAKQAKVMECFCRAYLAALERDWKTADEQFSSTDKLTKDIQRNRGDLYKWTQGIKRQLRDFGAWRINRRQYVIKVDETRKAISAGELEQAEKLLQDAKRLAQSDERVEEIKTLERRISEEQKQTEYSLYISRGDEMATAGNVSGAIAAWDEALKVLESASGAIPPDIYKGMEQKAKNRKTSLRRKTDYAAAMREAEEAEKAGNLLVAASAYEKAAKNKPDEEESLLTKARDLKHDHHLRLGQEYLLVNKIRNAERELKKARSYKASSDVETELKKVIQRKNYKSLLEQGDKLLQQKNYEAALEKYESAGKLSSDAELRSKMTDCRYHIELITADAHRVNAKWLQAETAYNKAMRIKPAAVSEINARLGLLRQDRIYAEQLAAARQALKSKDLAEALIRAESAKNVRDTPEIEHLIKRIRYERQVMLGTEAMNREDYNGASAYFRQAKRFLATPEIDKLIEQAEKLKEAVSPGS